jgi:predicted nucleotidyltransferase
LLLSIINENVQATISYKNRTGGCKVEIYFLGSRAKGTHSEFSDFDLAFHSKCNLEEILENSNFLYKVDLIDLRKSPYM